jgi:Conjugal transfer protein
MKAKTFLIGAALFARSLWAADLDRVTAGPPSHEFRVIDYDGQKIPDALDAMLRYNTVIRLPKGELVREASAGDGADLSKPGSGDWIIVASTDGDAVYAKPTRPGVATNIEIRTDHGNRYSFFIQDHSQDKGYRCHLENIVNPTGQGILDALKEPPKYIPASKDDEAREEAERYKKQRDEIEAKWTQKYTDSQITGRLDTLAGLRCDYDLKHSKVTEAPFHISNICHDKQFTYLWAPAATEHFGIQDYKQGAMSLIVPDYDPKSGIYTVHHVIEHGRVQIGSGKKAKTADFQKGAA